MALSFERVRQQAGDVVGASWSIMSRRRTELTRVNKRPRPQGTAERERDSRFLRRDQSAIRTGLRLVDDLLGNEMKDETAFEAAIRSAANTTRREALPVERSCSQERDRETNGLINARGTRHTVKLCPSNDRLLENRTERQTVSSTRRGTRHTVKLCPSNDRLLENKNERQTVSSTRGEQDAP